MVKTLKRKLFVEEILKEHENKAKRQKLIQDCKDSDKDKPDSYTVKLQKLNNTYVPPAPKEPKEPKTPKAKSVSIQTMRVVPTSGPKKVHKAIQARANNEPELLVK